MSEQTRDWSREEEADYRYKYPGLWRALSRDRDLRLDFLSRLHVRPGDIEPMSDEAREQLHQEVLANDRENIREDVVGYRRTPNEIERSLKKFVPPTPREMFRKYVQKIRGDSSGQNDSM